MAGRISSGSVDRVREAVDMVEVVTKYTELRRAGARFTGLCPFHDERTPSFSVDPAEKLYHCFGCQAGGDVFKLVCEKESIEFPDAVEMLAERYGVELEREESDPQAEEARKRRSRLHEALERAAGFYSNYLWEAQKATKAREYLLGRGLNEQVLRDFGVGFAPSAWDQLLVRGQQAGYSTEELYGAGLIQKGKQDGFYDRFRGRVTFPIRDHRGRVLGFGARAMTADSKPKYLNSPEGELYRKSRTLFGIDRARGPITRAGHAVVVEGYTDVLALHQAGIEEAVAVMGTAITPEQLTMLGRYCESVVLALDADRAGREAMLRARRVAGAEGLKLRVARMPEGTDPAEMLAAGETERFRELIEAAEDLPVFHVRSIIGEADLTSPSGRDKALDEAVPVIAAMGETISRDELVREVAGALDADPGLVARRVKGGEREVARAASEPAASPEPQGSSGPAPAITASTPRVRREHALLAMCVADPKQGAPALTQLTPAHFSDPVAGRALDWLTEHLDAPTEGLPREDDAVFSLISKLVMAAANRSVEPGAIELNRLELELGVVEDRMTVANTEGDGSALVVLQRERAALKQRIAGRDVGSASDEE